MEDKIKNTVAFVTGGASGIGKAIVEELVKHGGKVLIVDQNPDGQAVADAFGKNVAFCKADVTSEVEIQHALNQAKKHFGGTNVVINSAGIIAASLPYDFEAKKAHPLDLYKKIMDVNVTGTFNVTRLAAGAMADNVPDENQQRGVIINLASVYGRDAPAVAFAYAASKAAVKGMTLPLARCFGSKGIRVVTISPGYTETALISDVIQSAATQKRIKESTLTPNRIGSPQEIAHLAKCIIENPFINAVDMEIAGGYHFPHPAGKAISELL